MQLLKKLFTRKGKASELQLNSRFFNVLSTKDLSFAGARKIQVNLQLKDDNAQYQPAIRSALSIIINQIIAQKKQQSIAFFIYKKGATKVPVLKYDYAPDGLWYQASDKASKQSYKLILLD